MGKKRKTRQEKIISDLRRRLLTNQSVQEAPKTLAKKETSLPVGEAGNNIYTLVKTNRVYQPASVKSISGDYILSDLKKTAILSLIALACQIVIYFALIK